VEKLTNLVGVFWINISDLDKLIEVNLFLNVELKKGPK